ncbi:MAG: hypothetical protein AB1345_10975 [Chloroflexota bacterium]
MEKRTSSKLRWLAIIGLSLLLTLGVVHSAKAIEIIEEDTIPTGAVIDDDVFISAERVEINGTVNGNVFAFGSAVQVNGTINGSLLVGAQNVTIAGDVIGSVYCGASSLILNSGAMVARNVFLGGFALGTQSGSQIGRDLLVGGYQAVLSGEVGRDLLAGLGALEITGKVGRDVKVDVGESGDGFQFPMFFSPPGAPPMIAPGIRVGKDAVIGGELVYTSIQEQAGQIKAQPQGGVIYQTPTPVEEAKPPTGRVNIFIDIGRWMLTRLRDFVTLLALGGLAVWKLPDLLVRLTEKVRTQPLPAAGWGFLTLIGGYAGALIIALSIILLWVILGAITLGGLAGTVSGVGLSGLSLIVTAFTLLVSYGSKLILAVLLGKLILKGLAPKHADHKVWPLLVGVFVYVFLRAIPLLGWLIGMAVTLLGLGAMWLVFQEERLQVKPA